MSEILAVLKMRSQPKYWLILDCGHRYKWSNVKPPKVGSEFPCPECKTITVVSREGVGG